MNIHDFTAEPKGAWLTLNRRCNFRCKWCYARDTEYNNDSNMSLELAKKLALIIKEIGIKNVMLVGGEPTMWESLCEFNKYAKEIGLSTTLITNAFLFGNDEYWENYKKNSCDYCVISIKGVHDKQLCEVAGISNIEMAKKGMERAVQHHKIAGAETVCSTLTRREDLVDIAKYAKEIGASSFLVSMCNVTIEDEIATDEYVIGTDESLNVIRDVYEELNRLYGEKLEIHTTLPYCVWPKEFIEMLIEKKQLCSACNVHSRSGIVFDYNGDVLFCNSIFNTIVAEYKKDFEDSFSLLSHLNSNELKAEYAEILRFPAECCSDCSQNVSCRGGCIANWMLLNPEICKPI